MTSQFFRTFVRCLTTCALAMTSMTQVLAADTSKAGRAGMTVTTTRPEITGLQISIKANGNISAWQEAFKRGDVLARFATETVEADLAVVRATETEARASLAEAKSNAARANSLKNSGALSSQQIGLYLTTELTARAKLEAMQAQVKVLELRLKKTQVLAPDDGEIISRQ